MSTKSLILLPQSATLLPEWVNLHLGSSTRSRLAKQVRTIQCSGNRFTCVIDEPAENTALGPNDIIFNCF